MSQFAEVNGIRIVSGSVTVPYYGAWTADLTLATPEPLASSPMGCAVLLGTLRLVGTVYRAAPFAGARSVRLVAGGGGWHQIVPARAYFAPGGLATSLVLGDVAREVGERIALSDDPSIGTFFTRESAPAARVLRALVNTWWVDVDGTTRTGDRPSKTIASDFQVVHWHGGSGVFEIATESMSDWMPGNTFSSSTVTSTQKISASTFRVTGDGLLRVDVLTSGASDQ